MPASVQLLRLQESGRPAAFARPVAGQRAVFNVLEAAPRRFLRNSTSYKAVT